MTFPDRRQAGLALGEVLTDESPTDPLVLALPRGGVPVAAPVADALQCDLDVLVVRKLGVPFQPELAMGALGEGGVVVTNAEVLGLVDITQAQFDAVVARETAELERRLDLYRQGAEPFDPRDKTAIIVDDGLATGSTARAAVSVIRQRGAAQIWVAVPVAPADTARRLKAEADRLLVLRTPRFFGAVGAWYDDFRQTTDEEVRALLAR